MGADNALFSKPKAGVWSMEFVPDKGWRLIDPNGHRQAVFYGHAERAQGALDAAQSRTDAASKRMIRPCLCCQKPFDSEGIHNRLCATCRHVSGEYSPHAVAPRNGRPR
jgi:hypothetical protein